VSNKLKLVLLRGGIFSLEIGHKAYLILVIFILISIREIYLSDEMIQQQVKGKVM
jgi:hypothetical protein